MRKYGCGNPAVFAQLSLSSPQGWRMGEEARGSETGNRAQGTGHGEQEKEDPGRGGAFPRSQKRDLETRPLD